MSIRCEEVVAALAAGGPIRRWRASRHAARCPRCAAARDELRQVARALSDVPPLTAVQRNLWVAAMGEADPAETLRAWRFRPALTGALAAALLAVVGLWWASRPVEFQVGPTIVQTIEPIDRDQEPHRDVVGLGSIVALSRELDELSRRAELLDARKDLDALLARLVPRGDSRGL